MGKQWKQCQTLFWGSPKSLQIVFAAMKLKDTPWKKSYDQPSVSVVAQSCPTLCDPMDCSPPGSSVHEIFRARILEWVAIKSRDITLPTKVHLVKAMVFPMVMYGCENWTVKKAERRRIDAFELWCWRRFLRVLWTARRSNQSIIKEISPVYSLEGLMLKLKLQ